MLVRFLSLLIFALSFSVTQAQQPASGSNPKLVVGLVVDQMRWDFLYRYSDRYKADGGFRRLLTQGFSNENTFIAYAPTVTACGHASIYTGSVPAINGITGNAWYDKKAAKVMYCTEDSTVKTVGSTTAAGQMSPRNMYSTTIGDELRLFTNFRSKVIGIAIKDRGAILPAGHAANGAYWYDSRTGDWITSTYYRNDLPTWVQTFNKQKIVDKYYGEGWKTLYPIESYKSSTAQGQQFEGKPFGDKSIGFPYDHKELIGKNYGSIAVTPHGNTMTLELAKAALTGENLGKGDATDMLAVSLSSPDYIGHTFGPNSIAVEDCYLRLDKDLGDFLNFLDQHVGKGNYLFFLSADHGVANVPGFMKANKLPAGTFDDIGTMNSMNTMLKEKFGASNLIRTMLNYQVHLNHKIIDSAKLDKEGIIEEVISYLTKQEAVSRAFDLSELQETTLQSTIREMIANGYMPNRSGDVQFILHPQYIDGGETGTTHGLWNPYDSHIPLVWLGWNIKAGKSNDPVHMSDIAPTIAAMLQIQMPNGCVGKPIQAIIR